jgi:hypothetical protein
MENKEIYAETDIEAQKLFEEIMDLIQNNIADTKSGGSKSTIDDFADLLERMEILQQQIDAKVNH